MSYSALGYTTSVDLPVVGKQNITFPLEKIVDDATNRAMTNIQGQLPSLLNQVVPQVLNQAEDKALNSLWPKVQPKLRSEIERGVDTGAKYGTVGVAAILLGVFIAAVWVKKGR